MRTIKNDKGFAGLQVFIVVFVVLVVAGAAWFVLGKQKKTETKSTVAPTTQTTAKSTETAPVETKKSVYDGWKEYCSTEEKSCFKYPSDWTYTSDSNEYTKTTTFESPSGSTLRWTAAIGGLGGGCDPDTDPHVFYNSVTELPLTPGFYMVETGDSATNATGISLHRFDTTPKTGDTGACITFPFFYSKNSMLDGALSSSGLSTSYDKVQSTADREAIKNILLSYHY